MMNARKALKELQSEPRPEGAVQPQAETQSPIPDPRPPRAAGPVDFVFSDLETFCAPPRPAPLKAAQIASQSAKTSSDFPTELENLLK
jgi:hypothetical protein